MKKYLAFVAAVGVGTTAHAQSNVTLYGVMDAGITYTSNQQIELPNGSIGGRSGWQATSGTNSTSVWGLRGSESLGGGLNAIFNVETGFSSVNGRLASANTLFDRTAMVGLQSQKFGTLTLGRQFESYSDFVGPFASSNGLGMQYGAHFGDINNLAQSFNFNNSIKYLSPQISGFQFGSTFSLGGKPGSFSSDRAWAVGAGYTYENFNAGIGYLNVRDPLRSVLGVDDDGNGYSGALSCDRPSDYCGLQAANRLTSIAAGASYAFGPVTVGAVYARAQLDKSQYFADNGAAPSNVRFDSYEINTTYQVTGALQFGLAYIYTQGKVATNGLEPKFHQVNFGTQYDLSKRTALYTSAVFQKAGNGIEAQIPNLPTSNKDTQFAVTVGVRHAF